MFQNIAIFGSSGAIGQAFIEQLSNHHPQATIHAFSRQVQNFDRNNIQSHSIHYTDEAALAQAANHISQLSPLDLVLITNGILHDDQVQPEKSIKNIASDNMHHVFEVNTIVPALIAKHFLPKMAKDKPAVFGALSARVGSLSDNKLGGWHAYRASKAALNMILKNAAIEMGRTHKQLIIVGLHPGTVDSTLSKPFQSHVPEHKLFTPAYATEQLLQVLSRLSPEQSGRCFAWDGEEIPT